MALIRYLRSAMIKSMDKMLFKKIAEEIEQSYGMSGLSKGLYYDFSLECTRKYLEKQQTAVSEIEYPLRLCVEMLHFSVWSCKKTENMKYSEIKELLLRFFDEDQIIKAQEFSIGKSEPNQVTHG